MGTDLSSPWQLPLNDAESEHYKLLRCVNAFNYRKVASFDDKISVISDFDIRTHVVRVCGRHSTLNSNLYHLVTRSRHL